MAGGGTCDAAVPCLDGCAATQVLHPLSAASANAEATAAGLVLVPACLRVLDVGLLDLFGRSDLSAVQRFQ